MLSRVLDALPLPFVLPREPREGSSPRRVRGRESDFEERSRSRERGLYVDLGVVLRGESLVRIEVARLNGRIPASALSERFGAGLTKRAWGTRSAASDYEKIALIVIEWKVYI